MFKNRFKSLHAEELPSAFPDSFAIKYEILKDQQTGILYCLTKGLGQGAMAMTPLLDADGKPMIDKSL
ncbi:MAG: DUF6440 family protein [Turicibacter sp.]|nr:DUF6440 family protein [Turicibacter sp.]